MRLNIDEGAGVNRLLYLLKGVSTGSDVPDHIIAFHNLLVPLARAAGERLPEGVNGAWLEANKRAVLGGLARASKCPPAEGTKSDLDLLLDHLWGTHQAIVNHCGSEEALAAIAVKDAIDALHRARKQQLVPG